MSTIDRTLFIVYCLAGPGAWLLAGYLIMVGRERMLRLRNSRAVLPATPPLISILVPAKDEGDHIRTCIERIAEQTYPATELIAINDRSTDQTGAVLDAAAEAADRPMRVIHIDHLPDGWLGKCHALNAGTKHATGEWLFFVDSDVKLKPECLDKMAALAIDRGYDAMSIMTTIETHRFVEKLMLPLLAATWATVFAADQTNEESEPDRALANGQVFLIRKSAYEQVGGHATVRDRIVEDVELMRLLKRSGFKTRLYAGRHLASTRMHTNLPQMFHAWARIFAGTARGSVWPMVGAIVFLPICCLGVYGAATIATTMPLTISIHKGGIPIGTMPNIMAIALWIAVTVHWLLITCLFGLVWRWSGNNPFYALLLPISVPIEIAILAFSIRRAVGGSVRWRGMDVMLRDTSRKSQ